MLGFKYRTIVLGLKSNKKNSTGTWICAFVMYFYLDLSTITCTSTGTHSLASSSSPHHVSLSGLLSRFVACHRPCTNKTSSAPLRSVLFALTMIRKHLPYFNFHVKFVSFAERAAWIINGGNCFPAVHPYPAGGGGVLGLVPRKTSNSLLLELVSKTEKNFFLWSSSPCFA